MTPQSNNELASRKLDIAIAELLGLDVLFEVVPFYHLDHKLAFNAATQLGLFGEQQDGTDVVYYYASSKHLVCSVDWQNQEMLIIASADIMPLAICKALVQLGEQDDA